MTAENHNSLPAEVQEIAAQGWRLFPLGSEGEARKRPAISDWPAQASSDINQLHSWTLQFPACNWAVLTGPESRTFVLDTDGRSGEAWLERQIESHGTDWMATRQTATAKGVHLYFAWPGTIIHNSSGEIASGVDVRGWHGYAVIPPSIHPTGVTYTWRTPVTQPILPAPTWLLDTIHKAQSPALPKRGNGNGRKIPEGERNATLTSLAGSMRRRGMAKESIEAALAAENSAACCPPLPAEEVQTIAGSIAHYEPEPILVLKPRPVQGEKSELFETAATFAQAAPVATKWVAKPWIPAGGMTEMVGKIKASGKTTFALAITRAVLEGVPFLNQPCSKSPVVYLTEQPESSLREALQKADLLHRNDLFLMRWHKAMGTSWKDLASAATEKAEQVSANLIVVDTLSQFAQLLGDAENNSGQALEVLRPLQAAQERGIAVLLVRHERKGDAEISDAGRGSSAFAGAVDVLLRLRRLGASHPATYRRLESLSRFDETPGDSVVEWTPEGYRLHDVAAVTLEAAERKLLAAVPRREQDAKTCLELASVTGQNRRTLERALAELVTTGSVKRLGAGVRGCAFRYYAEDIGGDDPE